MDFRDWIFKYLLGPLFIVVGIFFLVRGFLNGDGKDIFGGIFTAGIGTYVKWYQIHSANYMKAAAARLDHGLTARGLGQGDIPSLEEFFYQKAVDAIDMHVKMCVNRTVYPQADKIFTARAINLYRIWTDGVDETFMQTFVNGLEKLGRFRYKDLSINNEEQLHVDYIRGRIDVNRAVKASATLSVANIPVASFPTNFDGQYMYFSPPVGSLVDIDGNKLRFDINYYVDQMGGEREYAVDIIEFDITDMKNPLVDSIYVQDSYFSTVFQGVVKPKDSKGNV